MIPVFLSAGHRVVAPDLPGFGKSDRSSDEAAHTFCWHRTVLVELFERLDLRNVNLVVQDWCGLLGLTLPMHAPEHHRCLLLMNRMLATGDEPLPDGFLAWRAVCRSRPEYVIGHLFARANPELSDAERAAYDAPFPNAHQRATTRGFPELVSEHRSADGVEASRRAAMFWSKTWQGRSMMAIGEYDPVFTSAHMEALRLRICGCPPPMRIAKAGHFLQEHGAKNAIDAVRALG
jgi:pimeloyl-ACP methyl ester carboxylesterase